MQHGFVAPGQVAAVPVAREIVPNINAIAKALRAGGGLVVYLQHLIDEEAVIGWSNYYNFFMTPERVDKLKETFRPGREGFDLWRELDVQQGDYKMSKRRFGAFVPGSSALHEVLQQRRIDTLIVTGTVTNVCCESTARDAAMLNYKVFFVSDANAALTDAEHSATLSDMASTFADVCSTNEMVGVIQASRVPSVAV
jgi:ureidoacrylate peracid hydrolase